MAKLDLKRQLAPLYAPSTKEVAVVDVPTLNVLAIDGQGDPNITPAYAAGVDALFSLSYTLKFAVKKGDTGVDYGVMPLEGLWWADDMADFMGADRSRWRWTMLIVQPEVVTPELVEEVTPVVARKKTLPALAGVRFTTLTEGRCAQIMHVGPFSAEGPTIERVHRFITDQGGRLSGKHHEIYLTDIRRADPSRWRTIIRQPFV